MAKKDKVGAVLVVGGGIGGMQASLDLADSGFKVYLLDKSPTIGGVMAQLDKTFPTNDCSMCIMAPKLVTCGRHLNIETITCAEVTGISGEPGNFEVTISQAPRSIDVEKCTGCGVCAQSCPVSAIDEYNESLFERAAIFIRYPQAVPLAYMIDKEKCVGCGLCENLCLADAVVYDDKERTRTLNCGAIILAPGFDEFDAKIKGEYGYGKYANVLIGTEFERILSASGPYRGHVLRPSDGDIPSKIAFIQCVGSRDSTCGNDYCSSVCCMFATKEAVIAREHAEGLESTIFYMDMRAYGKDFDKYITRAEEEYGVRFVRARVSGVEEVPQTENLRIKYEKEDGKLEDEEFDMVVLSIGFRPSEGVQELAKSLGIELNKYGFCKTNEFEPVATSRPGIFVCGAFQGPKDIPETVMQASGAASCAGAMLAPARDTMVAEKEYPPELDVSGQEPRIGAFICHCGINIGGYVDVPAVVEYAKTLPGVVYAESNLYTCSQDTQEKIKEMIKEHNLNRVVVASCTPRTHEPLFQETCKEAGLNKYLFEMANIRDQCSWVHMREPELATAKAKDLVRMAVAKARQIESLPQQLLDVIQRGLVIGGGLSGMTAALALANSGLEVFLVEREPELGGNLRRIYYTLEGRDTQELLKETIEKIRSNKLIKVFTGATIKEISGFVGNFKTKLVSSQQSTVDSQEIELEHGAIIVATGGEELKTEEYLYGKNERVITQLELEKRLTDHRSPTTDYQNVVMIQCVGSREDERPYCSRFCCSEAIKNALKINEISPETNIFILYRDMRTYGFKEEYYKRAREAGVIFIRYDQEDKPKIVDSKGKKLRLQVSDPILKEDLCIDADLLVLSVATVPRADNKELAEMLKVPLNDDNFFLEAHVKLRPVEFATDGVFLCGLAHSPKFIEESIAQAEAAASRACTILTKEKMLAEGIIASVNEDICSGCGVCEVLCPYSAIEVDEKEKVAKVNEALCKGCGTCCAACPSGAAGLRGFKREQILSMVGAALEA